MDRYRQGKHKGIRLITSINNKKDIFRTYQIDRHYLIANIIEIIHYCFSFFCCTHNENEQTYYYYRFQMNFGIISKI